MELIGGLIIAGFVLALGALVGLWAKRNPTPRYTAPEESGISEREWMDAIK